MTQDTTPTSSLRQRATPDNRPSTPSRTPIDTSSFYGTTNAHGSSHTGYTAPDAYREPELVVEDVDQAQWGWGDPSQEYISPPFESWGETTALHKISIDGRDEHEELCWYDAALRTLKARPGSGVLPPLLAEMLHDPDHALFSVSPNPPDPLATPPPPFVPSLDEVRMAVPHPNAYFCREHNGWVLLLWRSSSVLPPLVKQPERPLPDQNRRKLTTSCVGDGQQPFGQSNVTHHWHQYEKAVDATKLNPPYAHGELLLDLYLCCQCSMYCLVSDVIPGVFPRTLVDEFVREKLSHPAMDKTPRATVIAAWETVQTIITNRLWRDERRSLPVTRPRFRSKLGWDKTVERMFEILGFPLEEIPKSGGTPNESSLAPPPIDPATPDGAASRTKLLRAWVEVSAWLLIYGKSNSKDLGQYNPMVLPVKADSARDMYQDGIGAHPSQISRGNLPDQLVGHSELDTSWFTLGMTPSTYSWELLAFAYLAQCRCDPEHTPVYFAQLTAIVNAMLMLQVQVPTELQTLILDERERSRFTPEDFAGAVQMLGFGRTGELGVELDEDVDDEFIAQAWRSARQRAWQDPVQATQRRASLNESLKIVAENRGSTALVKVWEDEKGSGMSPATAYSTLSVPEGVDETMLLAVYSMRVEDSPSQAERMREALGVIAEVTNSERLRQFLNTGSDPGDGTAVNTTPDMPRGLNQLGNTCYLNSLLQYFYTIKDLRAAIASLSTQGAKAVDDTKVTDDDLKRHRVGGRLVTRREVLRSKKFVTLLADLFWNMEYCETAAVTPELELAKLALVTSQDEEEDETDRAGTDSSNDTDATLVDDMAPRPSRAPAPSPPPIPQSPTGSVLGKRHRDTDGSAMDVDTPAQSPRGMSPRSPGSDPSMFIEEAIASSSRMSPEKKPAIAGASGDVEMKEESQGAKAPPLPPRKRPTDDSTMMFGRQHDVSECMDNCMFQIETALLDFQGMATSDDDKTSPVKRLFYGKKKQRLIALSSTDDARHQSSIHEKEDLFSHLHVNVADEGFDIYDGLARYFDDTVDISGQKKRMEVSLVDLPPLLQIQLQRVQFNRDTQQAYKSQAYVKFGETIYMDRFLDSASPEKKTLSKAIHSELTSARDRVTKLTQGKHAPFAPALGNVAEFLAQQSAIDLPVDEELVTSLRSEESLITEQLRVERDKLTGLKDQLEDIWKDETSAAYELTSVFIHRGSSPSWGHYFFYSRNLPDQPESWFKYNDSDVSSVSKDEVLADTTGSTANPYMLVFVRKGCDAIDTVHRFNPDQLLQDE